MQIRTKPLLIAAAMPLFAAPMLAQASPSAAMEACVKAVLSSEVAKDRKVIVRKGSIAGPIALSGTYQIEVVAKGRESGTQFARVMCHTDSRGMIVALNGQPISTDTPKAVLSSR